MKTMNLMTAVAMIALTVGVLASGLTPENGAGPKTTATVTPQIISLGSPAAYASIYNGGTTDVFAQINISTNLFARNIASNAVVTIPAGQPYTFVPGRPISSLCWASASGTQPVYITFQQ